MLSKQELITTPEYWLESIQNELYRKTVSYMQSKNINQTELAKELGVSKGYISQILNGNFNFTISKLIELSLHIGTIPNLQLEKADVYINRSKMNGVILNTSDTMKTKITAHNYKKLSMTANRTSFVALMNCN